ncbi:hypothetical protein BH23CHL3_BH23CHL3_10930 [soil metagenome]|jgi:hypothetical protein
MPVERVEIDDKLLRRVLPYHVKDDGSVSSAAFMTRSRKPDSACSVFLERMPSAYDDAGKNRLPNQQLARFAATVAMDMGMTVTHVPTVDLLSHCEINIKTKQQCREFATNSELVPFA